MPAATPESGGNPTLPRCGGCSPNPTSSRASAAASNASFLPDPVPRRDRVTNRLRRPIALPSKAERGAAMPITSFEGKTAFVTGGASGIGLGIAKVLVARGAKVVLADLRQDHIDDALAEFAGGGQSNAVSALQLDVTNRAAYREAAERMQDEFGGIDILVNNAGVGLEGPVLQATYADYDFGFGVNVGGVINGFVEFVPQIIAHGRGGHVVSTASLAAEVV